MKRSFMRSRNGAKLCMATGPYSRRPLNSARQMATVRSYVQISRFSARNALVSINCRRGSTWSPIKVLNN